MAFETFEITHGIEDAKPILPPLHTLNLPFLSSRPSYDNLRYSQRNSQRKVTDCYYFHGQRMTSSSSSCTSPSESGGFSRTTSPSPPDSSPSLPLSSSPTKFRLEPCTLDKADAVILVPPPSATNSEPQSASLDEITITPRRKESPESKPLFLVGPALQHFQLHRHSRPLAKGARVHPYRIVRRGPKSPRN